MNHSKQGIFRPSSAEAELSIDTAGYLNTLTPQEFPGSTSVSFGSPEVSILDFEAGKKPAPEISVAWFAVL